MNESEDNNIIATVSAVQEDINTGTSIQQVPSSLLPNKKIQLTVANSTTSMLAHPDYIQWLPYEHIGFAHLIILSTDLANRKIRKTTNWGGLSIYSVVRTMIVFRHYQPNDIHMNLRYDNLEINQYAQRQITSIFEEAPLQVGVIQADGNRTYENKNTKDVVPICKWSPPGADVQNWISNWVNEGNVVMDDAGEYKTIFTGRTDRQTALVVREENLATRN